MGQIKNIKLHIVTDIKVNRSKVTTRMAVLTDDSGNVAMDEATVAKETEEQRLYNDVLQTSRFFTSLVELLPAKFYLGHRGEEEENVFNPKHMKKRKKKKPPADKKFLAKKAKLFKLDPSQHKTITELQEEVEKKEKEELAKNLPRITMPTKIQPISVSEVTSTQSLADLHDKLHAKMDELRGNRKVVPEKGDKINDRKRKHLDKKKLSSEKKRKEKESGNIKISNAIENNALNNNNNNKNKNNGNDIVFSKFDFATSVKEREPKNKKKKKDLKQLLNIAESKQNELKLLEETDAEKAKETKTEMCWDSALQKAGGTKIKDNPKLLKKTLKRKEKEKSKSEKVWKDRVDTVEKNKEEKQKLRKQHLKERREAGNGKKKGGGAKKKKKPPKKHTPGF